MRIGRTVRIDRGQVAFESAVCHLILGVLFLVVLCFAFFSERDRRDLEFSFAEIAPSVKHLESDRSVSPALTGQFVHFSSRHIVPDSVLEDAYFGVKFEHSLKVDRHVEFCQWIEHAHDHVEKDRDGHEVRLRTFTYTKQWVSHPVLSALYDQPFAHHNPQAVPVTSTSLTTSGATVGDFHVNSALLRSMSGNQKVRFNAAEIVPTNGFSYIGDGVFYLPYSASQSESILKAIGQLAEGTLLDFQIGDLFSRCTAGDVRVYFSACAPTEVSVLALQESDNGDLSTRKSSSGQSIGFIHVGVHSVDEMLATEKSSHFWSSVFVARSLVVAIAAALVLVSPTEQKLLAVLCMSTLSLGLVWLAVWGISFPGLVACSFAVVGLWHRNRRVNKP